MNARRLARQALLFAAVIFGAAACEPTLSRQYKIKPLTQNQRHLPPAGTVALEQRPTARPALSAELLRRGRDGYDVHCAVCHGFDGGGDGVITHRGFAAAAPLAGRGSHAMGVGEIESIIAHGRGRMFAMNNRLTSEQRWAIAAFVLALRASRDFPLDRLSPDRLSQLTSEAR